MYKNEDSPFHRVVESDLDRKILAVKTNFTREFEWRLAANPSLRNVQIFHSPLSPYITADFVYKHTKTKLNYDMDKKQFLEPHHTFDTVSIAINNGRIFGLYEREPELRKITSEVMAMFYEVSKTSGMGTRFGDNWINADETAYLADNEIERLLRISEVQAQREKKEQEDRKKRDADFIASIRSGF